MRHALTIAGSDSGGGAGIQADLKTFAAFGVYGTSAITAITAQNTRGVTAVAPLPADLVTAQIEAIARDIRIDATKIGMLATAAIVEAVAAAIEELALLTVVLDPVMVSSSGQRLLDEDGVRALRVELLPRARVITPNIPEAEVLSGCRDSFGRRSTAGGRASDRNGRGRRGHYGGPPDRLPRGPSENVGDRDDEGDGADAVDLLFDGSTFIESRTPRAERRQPYRTAPVAPLRRQLAAGLALGDSLPAAARRAQQYVAGAIAHGIAVGHGARVLDHFWQNHDHRRDR